VDPSPPTQNPTGQRRPLPGERGDPFGELTGDPFSGAPDPSDASRPAQRSDGPPQPSEPDVPATQQADAPPSIDLDGSRHRRVLVDGEVLTVAESDLTLDEDEFRLWQEAQRARRTLQQAAQLVESSGFGEAPVEPLIGQQSRLVGMVRDGKFVRWAPGTVLTYCVLYHTFPRSEWYEEVVDNMQVATEAWEEICGVNFRYVPELDNSDSTRPEGVLFGVRHINAGGAFIAASFFPDDPASRRRVLVDPSYYTTTFDHVGVFRHELGHVLGFRHEHIRSGAPPICPHESTAGTINLTDYDPRSVMHYFCGGVGSRTLQITDVDRVGAQQVYGPPLSAFAFVDAPRYGAHTSN
jgi:hypothetical protein